MRTNNVIEQIDYVYIVEVLHRLSFIACTNWDIKYITLIVIIEMSLNIIETMITSDSRNPSLSNKFEVLSQLEDESNE
jgi:hypothetical protein